MRTAACVQRGAAAPPMFFSTCPCRSSPTPRGQSFGEAEGLVARDRTHAAGVERGGGKCLTLMAAAQCLIGGWLSDSRPHQCRLLDAMTWVARPVACDCAVDGRADGHEHLVVRGIWCPNFGFEIPSGRRPHARGPQGVVRVATGGILGVRIGCRPGSFQGATLTNLTVRSLIAGPVRHLAVRYCILTVRRPPSSVGDVVGSHDLVRLPCGCCARFSVGSFCFFSALREPCAVLRYGTEPTWSSRPA
jgi:hypothetical protein